MKLSESIKSSLEFKNVYENGRSYANKYLVMYILKKDSGKNRLGISVSKKVGNSVVRHRLTRIIRESYRLNKDKLENRLEIVVIARKGAKGRNYWEISSAFMHLCGMHKILKEMIES